MFGMEDNKEQKQNPTAQLPQFSFELEQEIRENPKKKKEIQQLAESRIAQMRKMIQKGCSEKEFAECEALVQGYLALATTVERVKT